MEDRPPKGWQVNWYSTILIDEGDDAKESETIEQKSKKYMTEQKDRGPHLDRAENPPLLLPGKDILEALILCFGGNWVQLLLCGAKVFDLS